MTEPEHPVEQTESVQADPRVPGGTTAGDSGREFRSDIAPESGTCHACTTVRKDPRVAAQFFCWMQFSRAEQRHRRVDDLDAAGPFPCHGASGQV